MLKMSHAIGELEWKVWVFKQLDDVVELCSFDRGCQFGKFILATG